jgi:long-chain acyl-CoA synthetase
MMSKQDILEPFQIHASSPFIFEAGTSRKLSYGDFYRYSVQAADFLTSNGVKYQDRVGICLENSVEFAALYFGCLLIGATAVPISPLLTFREIKFILMQAGVEHLIYSVKTRIVFRKGNMSDLPIKMIPLFVAKEMEHAETSAYERIEAYSADFEEWKDVKESPKTDLFSITYTSGTTNRPKGVAHRSETIFGNARRFNHTFGLESKHRYFHVMPMSYMAGMLNTLFCPYMCGGSIVIQDAFSAASPLTFWQPVIQHQANTFWFSPSMLASLVKLDRDPQGASYAREHIQTVFVGTAPLSLTLRHAFEEKYRIQLSESYGLSELLIISANINKLPEKSVGKVLSGIEVRIVDEEGSICSRGTEGEIQICTPYRMQGYIDPKDSTPNLCAAGDWYLTGDVGKLDPDDNLFIVSRKKDLIIRGGINVSPQAVEEVLLQHDAIDQVAVIGLPHDFLGEEVVAAIKLKSKYHLAETENILKQWCKERLNTTSRPTKYVAVKGLPRNLNGKVEKDKLRASLVLTAPQQMQ